jgi:hypothetical protein
MISKSLNMIVLLVLQCCLILSVFAQEKLPGRDSKEWNDLTVSQRWLAVNIPEDQLRKMSTNELVVHCVNFDFMWDIFNHQNYGTGLNVVIENHNGLQELLNRKDAGKLIFDYYKKIDPNKIIEISELTDRGEFVAKVFFLELFLSHTKILNQFQGNEKELINAMLKTHDTCLEINKKNGKDYFSGYSIGTKALVIGRALDRHYNKTTSDPALEQMDLSKLTDANYYKILEEARKL